MYVYYKVYNISMETATFDLWLHYCNSSLIVVIITNQFDWMSLFYLIISILLSIFAYKSWRFQDEKNVFHDFSSINIY